MRLIPARAWGLIVLSALLQIVIFPIAGPLPAWRAAVAWFALVPLFVALLQGDRNGAPYSIRNAALLGYLCGILWYMGNCYWIYQTMHQYGGIPEPVSFAILVLFALYLGLYHALFAICLAVLRRSNLSLRVVLALTPFVWGAIELARARITGFPWDLLGYSQIDNSLLTPVASIAGVMAISFFLAASNSILAYFTLHRSWRFAGLCAIAALAISLGSLKANLVLPASSHNVAVMMQENIEVGAVGRGFAPLTLAQELNQFSVDSMHPERFQGYSSEDHGMVLAGNILWVADGKAAAPTVIIWPEAPSHLMSSDPYFRALVGELARVAQAPAIIGSLGIDRAPELEDGYSEFDSAALFNAEGNYAGRYDKIHLVPWGEYTPFPEIFGFVHKLTEGIGNMQRGHTRSVFATGGHSYGVFVCYESIFGDEVRHFADNGAQVLVQISDDGWYGDSGAPWQHLNMARMRAIENHRWLLRSTNTGITTAIDPYGRMAAQAPRHVRAAFAFPFDFTSGTTFYTRHGDWFAWLCTIVTFAGLLLSSRSRFALK